MNITFKNSPISINGVTKFASQGSISEEVDFQRVGAFAKSSVATSRSSRPRGSFSATYYLSDDDSSIRSLTGINPITGSVGGLGFVSGYMSNYSLSVEPNGLMQATLSVDFYSTIDRTAATGTPPAAGETFAHGGASTISGLLFNETALSFDYQITQTITPEFEIGGLTIIGVNRTDGEISCSIQGSGIGEAVQFSCPDSQEVVLNLATLCNGTLGEIRESGLRVRSSNLNLSSEGDAVGEVSLVRYF